MTDHHPDIGKFGAPADAVDHYRRKLELETDCADVHAALQSPRPGFTLLDVRSPEAFDHGHVAGAVSLPHRQIDAGTLERVAPTGPFVVYCWGPHCNGADKAALAIAAAGRRVKIMIGGVHGWKLEGHALTQTPA